MTTFNENTIKIHLENLNGWQFTDNVIEKQFQFKDFTQALGFIVKVGVIAEKMNHHPELLNVYNKVKIRLFSHDSNGVTIRDIDLAKALDEL